MQTLERFLALLFGAIVVMLILTNPSGVNAVINGIAKFTTGTVSAFAGARRGI